MMHPFAYNVLLHLILRMVFRAFGGDCAVPKPI